MSRAKKVTIILSIVFAFIALSYLAIFLILDRTVQMFTTGAAQVIRLQSKMEKIQPTSGNYTSSSRLIIINKTVKADNTQGHKKTPNNLNTNSLSNFNLTGKNHGNDQ